MKYLSFEALGIKSQEPRGKGQEPRGKSQEPRGKGQEPRGKSQEPRGKSQEPRGKNQESRARIYRIKKLLSFAKNPFYPRQPLIFVLILGS
jgi:hypothetical protein